jgi:hypothetical protein
MDDKMNLYDFIKEREIMHNQDIHSYMEGLMLMVQKPKSVDGITYYFTNQFSLMNIDCLKIDDNGYYYYEFRPERNGDIIDEIKYDTSTDLDAKLTYSISGMVYLPEEFNEFLFVSAIFNEFKVRITFMRKPVFEDTFKIISRYWLLDREPRMLLQRSNVITKYNIYNDGLCKRLNYNL